MLTTFEDGALLMASELIAQTGDTHIVADALNVMGISEYDCSEFTNFDKENLSGIHHDEINLTGLEPEE